MEHGIYLDCHSTTPVAAEVLDAMLPWFGQQFGNAGSHSHRWGQLARDAVSQGRDQIARCLGVRDDEVVFTSGATESNNLAILGVAEKLKRRKSNIVSLPIEHPSILMPLERLSRNGWDIRMAKVNPQGTSLAGQVDLDSLEPLIDDQTALVSLAAANNEIGVLQPIGAIAERCHRQGAWLHVDASQAVGWMDLNIPNWSADLVSFSGHKFQGPKGVGMLYVRREATYESARPVRLLARTIGGGQESGMRSGTLNVPGIVGMATAMELAQANWSQQSRYVADLRDRLWQKLQSGGDLVLNGPALETDRRLPNNLNFLCPGIEGQSVMALLPDLALSSGSACSSAEPGVSTVLTAIGLSEDLARCSLRIGLGRFHDQAQMDKAATEIGAAIGRLKK